jgi:hypothetical protein
MASMDIDTVQSVEQSHFIRNYDAAVRRMSQEQQIPAKVRALISVALGQGQLEDYQPKAKALPQPEIQETEAHVDVEELSDGLREIYLRHVSKEQICQKAYYKRKKSASYAGRREVMGSTALSCIIALEALRTGSCLMSMDS